MLIWYSHCINCVIDKEMFFECIGNEEDDIKNINSVKYQNINTNY